MTNVNTIATNSIVGHSSEAACQRVAEIVGTAIGGLLGVRRGGLPLAAQMDVPVTSIVYHHDEMCHDSGTQAI